MKKSELIEIIIEVLAGSAAPNGAVGNTSKVSSDVSYVAKVMNTTPSVQLSLKRINNPIEFKQEFQDFVGRLGIKKPGDPDKTKTAYSKSQLLSAVNTAFTELDWK